MQGEFLQEQLEIVPSELPVERLGNLLVLGLEADDALGASVPRREVVGNEGLALEDGEVDFHLVKPTGMQREMHQHQVWPLAGKPIYCTLTAMERPVINYQKDPFGRTVGLLSHELCYQSIEGWNTSPILDSAKELGAMHVPGSQISQGAQAPVFVLHAHRLAAWLRWKCGMETLLDLDACAFVGAENVLIPAQGVPLPAPLIQVQDPPGLFSEGRVAREEPTTVIPGANSVGTEPAPNSCSRYLGDDATLDGCCAQGRGTQAREGQSQIDGQLTGQRFDFTDYLWGKNAAVDLGEAVPPDPSDLPLSSAGATCRRPGVVYPTELRLSCSPGPARPTKLSWPAPHHDTVTYSDVPGTPRPSALWQTKQSRTDSSAAILVSSSPETIVSSRQSIRHLIYEMKH